MPFFTPEYLFKDVTHITPAFLHRHGILALVLDVDNTLTSHGSQLVSEQIASWIHMMRKNGIKMMIASNNFEKRVAPFARMLEMDYVSFCCKPSPWGLLQAQRRWKLPRRNIALVGDQIFTDALAAHLYGVRALLVRPLVEDNKASIRFKRKLEKPVLLHYYKKGGKLL